MTWIIEIKREGKEPIIHKIDAPSALAACVMASSRCYQIDAVEVTVKLDTPAAR